MVNIADTTRPLAERAAALAALLDPASDDFDLNFRGPELAALVRELAGKAAALDTLAEHACSVRRAWDKGYGTPSGYYVAAAASGPWFGATLQAAAENMALAYAPGVGHRPDGTVRGA